MGNYQLALHSCPAYQVHEEGFTRTVFTDDQAKGCTSIGNLVQIFLHCKQFGITANLNVFSTQKWGYACT